MLNDRKDITVTAIDKIVTYASGWSYEDTDELKTAPSTTPNSPPFYMEFVWEGEKSQYWVKEYVENWFAERNIPMAKWEKTIHVKHIHQCRDELNKKIEVWGEYNYNGSTGIWVSDIDIEIGNTYVLSEGYHNYYWAVFEYIRWLGSPNSTGLWVTFLYSNYPAQYKVVNLL